MINPVFLLQKKDFFVIITKWGGLWADINGKR